MRIKFTKGYAVKAAKGETYKEGQTVDLPDRSAQHFLNRGVAEEVETASDSHPTGEASGDEPVDYDALTKADLHTLADQRQVEGVTASMTKDELVRAVKKADRAKK